MKKRTFKRLAVITAALALVSTTAVAGTMAKYISVADTTGTGAVALWDVDFTGGNMNATETIATGHTFNIVDTTIKSGSLVDTQLAPGTSGEFHMIVTNNSEVQVALTIAIDEVIADGAQSTIPANMVFCDTADGTYGTLAEVEAKYQDKVLDIGSTTATELDIAVFWKWEYGTEDTTISEEDKEDIADGEANGEFKIKIDVVAVQVNPTQA